MSVFIGLFNLFNITLKLDPSLLLLGNTEKTEPLYLLHFQISFLGAGIVDLLMGLLPNDPAPPRLSTEKSIITYGTIKV